MNEIKVHETPSEESVTLMGRDIEIRIAFKGQAKALKQFRNMLVPAGASTTTTTTGEETREKREMEVILFLYLFLPPIFFFFPFSPFSIWHNFICAVTGV